MHKGQGNKQEKGKQKKKNCTRILSKESIEALKLYES